MISIVGSSSRSNDVFFQYARTPLGKSPSAADCHAIQGVGSMTSTSGAAAGRRASTTRSPSSRSGDAQAKPTSINGSSPSSNSGRGVMNVTMTVIASGISRASTSQAAHAAAQLLGPREQRPGEDVRAERVRPERE